MEKKQTAVDYLVEQLIKQGFFKRLPIIEIQQASQMEKEQIIDAYYEGKEYGFKEQGEQYYNETYGGQDVEVYSKNNTEKKYNCDYCHDMGRKYIGVPLGHLSCPQCKKY
jgi:hypothetical protein